MKILMSGSTGLVGQALGVALVRMGHTVIALTRDPEKAKKNLKYPAEIVRWDAETDEVSAETMRHVDAVVHLAGETVAGRWSEKRKREILNSRAMGSEKLVQSVLKHGGGVRVFISASGVSYYGFSEGERAFTEASPKGEGFLAQVSEQWELPLQNLPPHVRNVIFRIAVVLGKSGGFLERVVPLFKKGLGGRLGSGTQWMCWVHIEDLVAMILAALEDAKMSGVYNASAGNIKNRDLTRDLCRTLGVFQSLPVPALALKLMYGEMSELLLRSQKVESTRWTGFRHREFEKALQNLLIELDTRPSKVGQ